jgi:hypothetical protein
VSLFRESVGLLAPLHIDPSACTVEHPRLFSPECPVMLVGHLMRPDRCLFFPLGAHEMLYCYHM